MNIMILEATICIIKIPGEYFLWWNLMYLLLLFFLNKEKKSDLEYTANMCMKAGILNVHSLSENNRK